MLQDNKKANFKLLESYFNKDDRIIIQAHDYPDHDAIASAYGMFYLFKQHGFKNTKIVYFGLINNFSLQETIKHFKIPLQSLDKKNNIKKEDKVILVDSYYNNSNVTKLDAIPIGVIDHHKNTVDENLCPYQDLRDDYGSCSTLIFEYFLSSDIEIPKDVASLFLMGIVVDTSFLSRGIHEADIKAYKHIYFIADNIFVLNLLKNSLSISYISLLKEAIESMELEEGFCFVSIEKETSPDVIAIMADFFLSFKEVTFSVVLAPYKNEYKFSVRSIKKKFPVDRAIKKAMKNIGFGGGHAYMGAGSILKENFTDIQNIKHRFENALKIKSKRKP